MITLEELTVSTKLLNSIYPIFYETQIYILSKNFTRYYFYFTLETSLQNFLQVTSDIK